MSAQLYDNKKLIELCTEKLEEDNNNCKALLIRASAYIKENEYKKAEEDTLKIIELNYNISTAYYLLGMISAKTDKKEESIKYLTKSIENDNNNVNAYFMRGAIYNEIGEYKKAIYDYNLALQKDTMKIKTKNFYKSIGRLLGYKDENRSDNINTSFSYCATGEELDAEINKFVYSKLKSFSSSKKEAPGLSLKTKESDNVQEIVDPNNMNIEVKNNEKEKKNLIQFLKENSEKSNKYANFKMNNVNISSICKYNQNANLSNINANNGEASLSGQMNSLISDISSNKINDTNELSLHSNKNLSKNRYHIDNNLGNDINIDAVNLMVSKEDLENESSVMSGTNNNFYKTGNIAVNKHANFIDVVNNNLDEISATKKIANSTQVAFIPDNSLSSTIPTKKYEKYEIYHNQGYAARKNENFPLAIEFYTKAINLNPNYFKAYFNRGFAYDKLGKYDEAIKDYSIAIELNNNSAYAYYNRAISYDKKGDLENTINDFTTAIKLLPTKIDFYLNRAYTYRKIKDFENAIKDYERVIDIEPNNIKAFYNRGLCYEKVNKFENAEKDLQFCLTILNGNNQLANYQENNQNNNLSFNVNIYYHLANILEKINKLEESEKSFKKAIEMDPKYAQPYHGLGLLMDKLGKYNEAIDYFTKSIKLEEFNSIFWHNRGCTYRNLGKMDLALSDINKAISLDPSNVLFYDNRAYLWRKMEKYKNAIADYNIILNYQNDNYKAMINRAFCNAKLENYEEAIKDYNNVLKKEINNTHALYNRAISYDKLGKRQEAIDDFTRIIELEPMNANAYLNRGCCYEKIQNSELAYKDYEASLLIDEILGKEQEKKNN